MPATIYKAYEVAPNFVENYYTNTRIGGVYAKCVDGRYRKVHLAVMCSDCNGDWVFRVPAIKVKGSLLQLRIDSDEVVDLLMGSLAA